VQMFAYEYARLECTFQRADSGYDLVEKQARCIKIWIGQVNETATPRR
jgi:hypothetical protein